MRTGPRKDGAAGDPLKDIPASVFADDDGSADARLAQSLIRFSRGKAPLAEVVDSLAYARVLVPVVAEGEDRIVGKHGVEQDHVASTGVVALQGSRRAHGAADLHRRGRDASLECRRPPHPRRGAARGARRRGRGLERARS